MSPIDNNAERVDEDRRAQKQTIQGILNKRNDLRDKYLRFDQWTPGDVEILDDVAHVVELRSRVIRPIRRS